MRNSIEHINKSDISLESVKICESISFDIQNRTPNRKYSQQVTKVLKAESKLNSHYPDKCHKARLNKTEIHSIHGRQLFSCGNHLKKLYFLIYNMKTVNGINFQLLAVK